MPLLILEGPDGSGKSTLAHALSGKRGFKPCVHGGGPPKDADELNARLTDMYTALTQDKTGDYLPYDRCSAISEQVYGPVLNHTMIVPQVTLDDFLAVTKPVIIYCRPALVSIDMTTKSHKSPEHMEQVRKNINNLVDAYDYVMRRLVLQLHQRVIWYDWRVPGQLNLLVDILNDARWNQWV